jgi:hypothetical protein
MILFKKKKPTWCFESHAGDNNGNHGVFIDIYDKVFDPLIHESSEILLSEDYTRYCFKNIHGLTKIKCEFHSDIFMGVRLYFKDEASYAWFLLRWS